MNSPTIDISKLRRALAETSREGVALKRLLRAPWVRPMAAEQKTLAALAVRMTMLCILRASLRGRYHVNAPPRGWEASWDRDDYRQRVAALAADRYHLWRAPDAAAAGESR